MIFILKSARLCQDYVIYLSVVFPDYLEVYFCQIDVKVHLRLW